MSRVSKRKHGTCHLCGIVGPLSFEHVPPKAAFNNRGVLEADIYKLLGKNLADVEPEGRISQRGAGHYTLCEKCNNDTGKWYAPAYIEFAHQAMGLVQKLPSGVIASATFRIQPLNVLKQIFVMFCSACPPEFSKRHSDLVRFLLNREAPMHVSEQLGIALALFNTVDSIAVRQSGITGALNLETGKSVTFSEISFPPFNLVMSPKSTFPDQRLFEITWFRHFDYGETAEVKLKVEGLPVTTYLPGVYQTPVRG